MNPTPFYEALSHTPPWVFAVLVALLLLGYLQSRNRTVTRGRLLLLPVAMLGFSLYGIIASFGPAPLPLLAWAVGFVTVALLGATRLQTAARQIAPGVFLVAGSWWPLALMMGVFFTRYAIGYAAARELPMVIEPWFVGAASALLGVFSGAFLARAGAAWRGGTRADHYA